MNQQMKELGVKCKRSDTIGWAAELLTARLAYWEEDGPGKAKGSGEEAPPLFYSTSHCQDQHMKVTRRAKFWKVWNPCSPGWIYPTMKWVSLKSGERLTLTIIRKEIVDRQKYCGHFLCTGRNTRLFFSERKLKVFNWGPTFSKN